MKRAAESQLTKDTIDDEDDSTDSTTGIQKADPASLSGRKIRGLPKRALASAATPVVSTTPPVIESSNGTTKKSPEPASRFSGFTGFGSSTPSAFTFTPPISQTKTNTTQTSQTTTTPPWNPSQSVPSSQSPKFSFVPPSNPMTPTTPPSTSNAQKKRDAGQKYYLFLRGLNTSFLDAITQAAQADPFVDIAEMLEKYKSLRSSALKDFNDSCSVPDSHQTSGAAPSSSKTPPSMPTPPKSFFGFGKGTSAGPTSQSHATGFRLDTSHKEPPSPFTLSAKIGPSDKPASFGASQFLTSNSEKSSSGKQTSAQLATPFGSSALQSSATDNTGSVESKMTSTPDKASRGQDALQGKSTASSPFSFKPSAQTAPLTPGFSSFLNFSKPSDIRDTKSNTSNPSPPSPSLFGFGTGKASAVSNPFSFGKGSIGNPVGFAFGTPPAPPDDVKPPETTDIESDLKVPSEGDTALSTPSQDPSPAPSQGSAYDADGPGEEGEVTLHEGKAYAYKLAPSGDKKNWVSVGKGQLKLKGRVDVKRRILMRNSNNGQVILNFNLFPGFTTNVSKRVISFCVPSEGETATMYQLRVPNEADAVNWQKAIQNEVDGLLPAHET